MSDEVQIQQLREALKALPANQPLRMQLAELLLKLRRPAEAAEEYRQALVHDPGNVSLQLTLARTYLQANKDSAALMVVEQMLKAGDTPAEAYLLQARLLLRGQQISPARRAYERAVQADPSLKDETLAEQLEVAPDGNPWPTSDASEPAPGAGQRQPWEAGEADDLPFDDQDHFPGRMAAPNEAVDIPTTHLEKPRIKFEDVGGMEDLKEQIRMKIIHPLTHPEIYKAYGKPIGGGILMYGPPGCGKTHLARATAGEVNASFISIGISDVLDMWIGNSERNLHEIFNTARNNAPCVLFFDEVDALGASRTDMRTHGTRNVINQFLSELDGVEYSNEGVLILAATNAPWHLDPAFRRPGRFDRILFVPPPDAPARAQILDVLLKGKPTEAVDAAYIAKKTDQFSGADLKAAIDVAVEGKLAEAMKQGHISPLTTKDLTRAAKGLRPTTREWFSSARNYALYSNQGGMYDDILAYLGIKK